MSETIQETSAPFEEAVKSLVSGGPHAPQGMVEWAWRIFYRSNTGWAIPHASAAVPKGEPTAYGIPFVLRGNVGKTQFRAGWSAELRRVVVLVEDV